MIELSQGVPYQLKNHQLCHGTKEQGSLLIRRGIFTKYLRIYHDSNEGPRVPFWGTKESGIGRELSKHGLREFVNIKSINVY